MSHEIIMPALGMNQDEGVISNWCKNKGDFVEVGDVIMEIETDKAIQEIESSHSGYLSQIIFDAGVSVPVGKVIAIISKEKSNSNNAAVNEPLQAHIEDKKDISQSSNTGILNLKINATSPKLLVSPKAKMLARKNGVSLSDVAIYINKDKIHTKDIEDYSQRYQYNSNKNTSIETSHLAISSKCVIKISYSGLSYCEAWLQEQERHNRNVGHLMATLLTMKMRELGIIDTVCCEINSWDKSRIIKNYILNPDLNCFNELNVYDRPPQQPNIRVIYLGKSKIAEIQANQTRILSFIVRKVNDDLEMTLLNFKDETLCETLVLAEQLGIMLENPLLYIT